MSDIKLNFSFFYENPYLNVVVVPFREDFLIFDKVDFDYVRNFEWFFYNKYFMRNLGENEFCSHSNAKKRVLLHREIKYNNVKSLTPEITTFFLNSNNFDFRNDNIGFGKVIKKSGNLKLFNNRPIILDSKGYPSISVEGVLLPIHQLIMKDERAKIQSLHPDVDFVIHHVDGNKLNYEYDNLEIMTNKGHSSYHKSGCTLSLDLKNKKLKKRNNIIQKHKDEILRLYHDEFLSIDEINTILNINNKAIVREITHKTDRKRKDFHKKKINKIIEMYKNGYGIKEIGKELNIPYKYIGGFLKEGNISIKSSASVRSKNKNLWNVDYVHYDKCIYKRMNKDKPYKCFRLNKNKYKVNIGAFKDPLTPEVIGKFIDGNVSL